MFVEPASKRGEPGQHVGSPYLPILPRCVDFAAVDPASQHAERCELLECLLHLQRVLMVVSNGVAKRLEAAGTEAECAVLQRFPCVGVLVTHEPQPCSARTGVIEARLGVIEAERFLTQLSLRAVVAIEFLLQTGIDRLCGVQDGGLPAAGVPHGPSRFPHPVVEAVGGELGCIRLHPLLRLGADLKET